MAGGVKVAENRRGRGTNHRGTEGTEEKNHREEQQQ
jgi:hypothetical protein